MLTLGLDRTLRWHDLAPGAGVRVQLRPLTTARMVTTRRDPGVEVPPEEASDEERAERADRRGLRRCRWHGNRLKRSGGSVDS